MRVLMLSALVLLVIATFTNAIPLPSSSSDDSSEASQESSSQDLSDNEESEVPVVALTLDDVDDADLDVVEGEEDADQPIVKREIPDPDRNTHDCGCGRTAKGSSEHVEHDNYLAYKYSNDRAKRQVSAEEASDASADNSDCVEDDNEEDEEEEEKKVDDVPQTSEEQQSSIPEQIVARRKRAVDDKGALDNDAVADDSGDDHSGSASEEQAVESANEDDEENHSNMIDDEANERDKHQPPSTPDTYSLDDYAQGCEETEIQSDEINETTYKDDKRRKRNAANSRGSDEKQQKRGKRKIPLRKATGLKLSDLKSFYVS